MKLTQKTSKKLIISVIVIVLILVIIGVKSFFKLELKAGGLYIGNSITVPYAYTIYSDHVVLESYKGNETEVIIPQNVFGKSVKEIGEECFYAFHNSANNNVTKVVLHDQVEIIGECAFLYNDGIQEIVGGTNVREIGLMAFYGCDALVNVDIGNKIEMIDGGAFGDCDNLRKFNRQDNLKYIGTNCFENTPLEEFEFAKDVTVDSNAFGNTPWLENKEEEFIIYGDCELLYYNGNKNKVIIPEGIKTILGSAFIDTMASEVYIPTTVTKICEWAFYDCKKDIRIYIPESVEELEVWKEFTIIQIYEEGVKATIVTTENSPAHIYAMENNIPYEIVDKIEYPN